MSINLPTDMQLKWIIFGFLSLTALRGVSQAQFSQFQQYIGGTFYPGKSSSLLSGFTTGFNFGGGVSKTIKNSFVFNPNLEGSFSSKRHYSISQITIHNNLKYYPFLLTRVRPYVMIIGNISFLGLHQQAFSSTFTPDTTYTPNGISQIPVTQITNREPDLKLSFYPIFGLGGGIGFDIPIGLKIVTFIQFSQVNYFTSSSSLINSNFKHANSDFTTQQITIGTRYNIFSKIK